MLNTTTRFVTNENSFHLFFHPSVILFFCVLRLFFQDPLKLDIVISFPDHGFHLRFDPWSQVYEDVLLFCYLLFFRICLVIAISNLVCLQRLRLVEIYDVKRLQMRYATSMIG